MQGASSERKPTPTGRNVAGGGNHETRALLRPTSAEPCSNQGSSQTFRAKAEDLLVQIPDGVAKRGHDVRNLRNGGALQGCAQS